MYNYDSNFTAEFSLIMKLVFRIYVQKLTENCPLLQMAVTEFAKKRAACHKRFAVTALRRKHVSLYWREKIYGQHLAGRLDAVDAKIRGIKW